MSVQVASCTLPELFAESGIPTSDNGSYITGRLAIPEYQRPYRWHDEQVNRLLEDFLVYKKEQSNSDEVVMPYYLGSIILHQENESLKIIDGQQRLTTLALIAFLQNRFTDLSLSYDSPESQQQIMHNLAWLQQDNRYQIIDLERINITLVVTGNEDDAYRFFETQNTGGVRLSGSDIIKAYHLRAIDEVDKRLTNLFAKRWEALGNLESIIDKVMKGRYWQQLRLYSNLLHDQIPLHNQLSEIRKSIVRELAEQTGKGKDIAYKRIQRVRQSKDERLLQVQQGYEMRQPLNAGVNTIHYLQYFQELEQIYLKNDPKLIPEDFGEFYHRLICQLEGCGYLKQLFDTCLLFYISQFGDQQLGIAAKKLFRVVYSRRVENQKAVKEKSVPAFVKKTPVLDWIAMSYTPEQCFSLMDDFELVVDRNNLEVGKNSVKKRFIIKVCQEFNLCIDEQKLADDFEKYFSRTIRSLKLVTEGEYHG